MARSKQLRSETLEETLPLAGAAGVSLAFAGGASATAPTEHLPPQDTPRPVITLSEEEISDVNLGTFYVFDKEEAGFGERVHCSPRLRRLRLPGLRGTKRLWRLWRLWLRLLHRLPGVDGRGLGLRLLAEHVEGDCATVYQYADALGCDGIVSKRKGSRYERPLRTVYAAARSCASSGGIWHGERHQQQAPAHGHSRQ